MAQTKKQAKKDYVYAVGRRKTSVARVRLYKGDKESSVNGDVIGKYFPGSANTATWQNPFKLTGTLSKYYVTVKVVGGGVQGQLEATVHGISRALSLEDRDKNRSVLKKNGLLSRDSRERQKRMAGTGGKARRAKQSPKR